MYDITDVRIHVCICAAWGIRHKAVYISTNKTSNSYSIAMGGVAL